MSAEPLDSYLYCYCCPGAYKSTTNTSYSYNYKLDSATFLIDFFEF